MRRISPLSPWFLLVLLQAFSGASSHAVVTVVSYWRLGETDPGASTGLAVTNTVDVVGGMNLEVQGKAQYTNDVASSAARHTGSTLSVSFDNSAYATTSIVSTATDNFGIECWVKPTALGGGQVIAYNGITGGNGDGGWGIIIAADNTYKGLFGGVTGFGTNVATPNVWTHLALVRDSGTSTLYINGAAVATAPNTPGVPEGNFALAAPPQAPTSQFFTGLLDEVRVFTFAAGQFSANDLLWNQTAIAATLPATAIGSANAELNGTFFPGGADSAVWFQYGLTTNYGSVTPATLCLARISPRFPYRI